MATEGFGATRTILLGCAAVLAIGIGGWWWLGGETVAEARRDKDGPPVPITPRAPGPAGWSVEAGQTVAIDADDLPETGTIGVDLVLGEASADGRPLSGRILSFDVSRENRVREIEAQVIGSERLVARVELPVDFLIEDLYLLEIKTTEKTALPVRRYRVEIR